MAKTLDTAASPQWMGFATTTTIASIPPYRWTVPYIHYIPRVSANCLAYAYGCIPGSSDEVARPPCRIHFGIGSWPGCLTGASRECLRLAEPHASNAFEEERANARRQRLRKVPMPSSERVVNGFQSRLTSVRVNEALPDNANTRGRAAHLGRDEGCADLLSVSRGDHTTPVAPARWHGCLFEVPAFGAELPHDT